MTSCHVIQSEAKNLGNIYFMLPRFFLPCGSSDELMRACPNNDKNK